MLTKWRLYWYGLVMGIIIGACIVGAVARAQGVPGVLENGQPTYQWPQADGSLGAQNPLAVPRVYAEPTYGRKPCP